MSIFRSMSGFGGRDMAVDLGTANTLVYVRGRGIVLSEPSVVAIDSRTGEVHAVGVEAKRMLGRTPGTIQAIRPLQDGVIADFEAAEEIKLEIGSAWDMKEELQAEVRGRDMLTGLPKTVILTSEEIRRALDEPVTQIIEAIKSTLDKTPPELAADIMDRGIVLAGGGALLTGLDERLRHETQMPVHLAESPLTCVAVRAARPFRDAYNYFDSLASAKSRAARLEKMVRDYRAQALLNAVAVQQNNDFKQLLHFESGPSYPKDFRAVNAAVLAFPSGAF